MTDRQVTNNPFASPANQSAFARPSLRTIEISPSLWAVSRAVFLGIMFAIVLFLVTIILMGFLLQAVGACGDFLFFSDVGLGISISLGGGGAVIYGILRADSLNRCNPLRQRNNRMVDASGEQNPFAVNSHAIDERVLLPHPLEGLASILGIVAAFSAALLIGAIGSFFKVQLDEFGLISPVLAVTIVFSAAFLAGVGTIYLFLSGSAPRR
jgi:hypothetical protein